MTLQSIFASFLEHSLEIMEEYHVQCHGILFRLPELDSEFEYPAFVLKGPDKAAKEQQTPEEIDQILVKFCKRKHDPLSAANLRLAKSKLPGLSIQEIQANIMRLLDEGDLVTKP